MHMHKLNLVILLGLFLFVVILVPLFGKFSYDIRIAPPDKTRTTFRIVTKDTHSDLITATIYFWGSESCVTDAVSNATNRVAKKTTAKEIVQEPKDDFIEFRKIVKPELTRSLQEDKSCLGTEILGWLFFYDDFHGLAQK